MEKSTIVAQSLKEVNAWLAAEQVKKARSKKNEPYFKGIDKNGMYQVFQTREEYLEHVDGEEKVKFG